jgi:hypothetical protein
MVRRGTSCLVGRLISDRYVSKEVIKSSLMRGIEVNWKDHFQGGGRNLFIIEFEHDWEKARTLEWRPRCSKEVYFQWRILTG